MGRYGGIDTDAFTRSLLGGAAIGQRTISLAQDQQALLERLRQNQLREQTDQNTARYLQTIFSGGQMPQGFDAGTVDPQAIQTGAQWADEIANRQAENDFYNGIYTGQPMQPSPRVSPQSLRFGMQYRQDQADARGMADQYAMARGEGPGMVGPQSPDVQSAYGMSAQAIAPMVRETIEQRAKRESAARQMQALREAEQAIDIIELSGKRTPGQIAAMRAVIRGKMNGLDIPMGAFGTDPQEKSGLTPEQLAPTIGRFSPNLSPEDAMIRAKDLMNVNSLDTSMAQAVLDPDRNVRAAEAKRLEFAVSNAQEKMRIASALMSMLHTDMKAPGIPEYDEALRAFGEGRKEYETASTALKQFYEASASGQPKARQAPPPGQLAPPTGQIAPDAMDAAIAANPQLPNEPDEMYAKRLAPILRGIQR